MLGMSLRTSGSTFASICILRPLGIAFALVIHADQIQLGAPERNDGVFAAQHFHPGLLVQALSQILGPRINFVIAVAAVDAERSAQVANFVHAIGHGIVHAGDEVAGDDGEIGSHIVGHVHHAAHRFARHVAAQVDIRNLDDLHAVQFRR